MNVKTSKQVTDRQRACAFVLSVFSLRGPAVAATLAEALRPHLGEMGMDGGGFRSQILDFAHALRQALARLVAADEARYAEQARLAALRQRRDDLARDLTRRVVRLRRAVVGLYVEPDLVRLGLAGETAREPVPLLRQADRIVATFQHDQVGAILGAPLFDHLRLDPRRHAEELKHLADPLREVVDQVAAARRRVEDAVLKKRAAMGAYDHLFLHTARIFEDFCRLAGQEDLADRVRPSKRRPGRIEEEPPEEMPEGVADGAPQVATHEPSQGARPEPRRNPAPGRADARRGPAAGARIPCRGDPRPGNADQGVPAAASPGGGFRAAPDHHSGRPKRTLAGLPRPPPRGLVQA